MGPRERSVGLPGVVHPLHHLILGFISCGWCGITSPGGTQQPRALFIDVQGLDGLHYSWCLLLLQYLVKQGGSMLIGL